MEWGDLLCDGVAKGRSYMNVSGNPRRSKRRLLAKLDTIKDDVIWWSAGADTPQLLAYWRSRHGIDLNGRLFSRHRKEQDQPVAMLWDAQVFEP